MRSNSDTQLLSEQYTNSIIKGHISKLISEGKTKEEIQQILQEAGFLQNMVQGAKNAYQNYWQDPRAIKAGQKAGYGSQGQTTRTKGQEAYNRQTTRKFQKQIQDSMKSLTKAAQSNTANLNKQVSNNLDKLFTAIQEEGPNLDPNFLIQQFDIVINTLNGIAKNSVDGITKGFQNELKKAMAMKNSMAGGMQQQTQQQQQPQQQAPQQQAPQQQAPPQAAAFQGAGGAPQNVVGVNNNNAAQLQTASKTPKIYKSDYVLMESAYDQVKKNGLVVD